MPDEKKKRGKTKSREAGSRLARTEPLERYRKTRLLKERYYGEKKSRWGN